MTRTMADAVRILALDAVAHAQSGHSGMPMGMADAATVLFGRFLNYDPENPHWPDRDRFVLSAGHGSMLLYALLHLTGYERPTMDDIRAFRQLGSPCAGHPEADLLAGVETTTGPLGQGLATAVGMAIAERHLNAVYGDALVHHRTWVIAGDGCLMEGISQEAISLAGHLGLNRLIVLWDDNGVTIDGPVAMTSSEDVRARFRAAGWAVLSVDGHDHDALAATFQQALDSDKPLLIACKTVIGYGAPTLAGESKAHGALLDPAEIAGVRSALGWTASPFEIPQDIAAAWRAAGLARAQAARDWQARFATLPPSVQADFNARMAGTVPTAVVQALAEHKAALLASPKAMATRKASEQALGAINAATALPFGGSADLTGSNNTQTPGMGVFGKTHYAGRYLPYGVREFGMAAAMNGLALHGGLIPYGGTFLVFSDYCRPAIRLAALQHQRVIFVFTHDSIGLGEDGPTHQPIEHLASLRAMPNLRVFRPADAIETAESWELALLHQGGPSVLALSRQDLPLLRTTAEENLTARGGYILRMDEAALVTLIASGSEVALALAAADILAAEGKPCAVVSMPCWELFAQQDPAYQAAVLPEGHLKVSVEAGATLGWRAFVGPKGLTLGIDRFGMSAPMEAIYEALNLTPQAVAQAVRSAL